MDGAIEGSVGASLAMQQSQMMQEAQTKVFKEAMETQENQIADLMDSAAQAPQLATEGSVGTQLNTFA
ncbi:putative motility protein [Aidingimonas lacisalsi]|uniref:putative motility protein n=1 Tax=Aidingimonas lacisalsi TaxID=2604086 RepID=UPI0011D291BD|nr:putative motility protein [Aidingimonas lacisalsi]